MSAPLEVLTLLESLDAQIAMLARHEQHRTGHTARADRAERLTARIIEYLGFQAIRDPEKEFPEDVAAVKDWFHEYGGPDVPFAIRRAVRHNDGTREYEIEIPDSKVGFIYRVEANRPVTSLRMGDELANDKEVPE
jgi:hypothetical protein